MILSGKTKTAGVMGWPISHSKSPRLHNYWLDQYGLDGAYLPFPVDPQHLEAALHGLKAFGMQGCNVTVPHKEAVMPYLDHITPRAEKIGAVNTIIVQPDQTLLGDNTDGYGYMAHLQQTVPDWVPSAGPVCMIGAGGAARAILVALLDAGVPEIRLTNRTQSRAEALADAVEGPIRVIPWAEKEAALADVSLLTNTTTLGMTGQHPLELDISALSAQAVVYDIVYAPLMTDLLTQAKAKGCPIVDGLGMLLHQARPGFEAWFAHNPDVSDALRDFVLASS